jgi:very-short-patch-repair endonuclease
MPEGINNIRVIRRISRIPKRPRLYVRTQDMPITRDRRGRPIEFGVDELESRAISPNRFAGATLPERIVYKALEKMMGDDSEFIFQRTELGGRNFLGGYVIDFVIPNPEPPLALEVLGDYWHQADRRYGDEERAYVLFSLGYEYAEVWEHDILHSGERLERILFQILGNRVSGNFAPAYS